MNRITHFSKHALERLEQRSTLTYYELAKILDCQVFIGIGREPGFNREHRLFYSKKDGLFYIAIQDIHTGYVVTVLPPEYHENISWRIKDDEFIAAKELALTPPKEFEDYENIATISNLPPSTFIVSAHFNDIEGKQKTKQLLKISSSPYNEEIEKLIKDKYFEGDILRSLSKKNITPDSVWLISIRFGQKGDRVYFYWENSSLAGKC